MGPVTLLVPALAFAWLGPEDEDALDVRLVLLVPPVAALRARSDGRTGVCGSEPSGLFSVALSEAVAAVAKALALKGGCSGPPLDFLLLPSLLPPLEVGRSD
jgi:hypothetical protein